MIGDAILFVMKVLIASIKEFILSIAVLAGCAVETLIDRFCFRTPQMGFPTRSTSALCGLPEWVLFYFQCQPRW